MSQSHHHEHTHQHQHEHQVEEVADLDVPIGMLYCLEPKPYGVDFKAFQWDKESEWFNEVPDFQLRRAQDDMK